jgi:hypothetical protein
MDEERPLYITQVAHFLHQILVNKACEKDPHARRTLPESFAGDGPDLRPHNKDLKGAGSSTQGRLRRSATTPRCCVGLPYPGRKRW